MALRSPKGVRAFCRIRLTTDLPLSDNIHIDAYMR
jgi:hypothetical protein